MTQRHHNTPQDMQNTSSLQEQQPAYEQAILKLASQVRGQLILPANPDYEDARRVWNGAYDRHPAAIVCCLDANDVRAAINFAREQGMQISVRSGGHSGPGHSTNDDGLVIDLSGMKKITIDPAHRTAHIEPGLTTREITNALQPYNLALTMGDVASVGIGGLLLGGGVGWMARKYGLTIDHLRAVELVTADGELLHASAEEHPDLFWGLRGGGGNFGVATAFEVNLDSVETILGGTVFYEATEAERILHDYARLATAAPDGLTTEALFMLAPPAPFIPAEKQGTPIIAITLCYTGNLNEGEQVIAPLRQIATPIADLVAPMPYPDIFTFTDAGINWGLQHHMRAMFVEKFSQEFMHTLVEVVKPVMSPQTVIQFHVLGGAISQVANDATAFAHRDKLGEVAIINSGQPSDDSVELAARTQSIFEALAPYANGVYTGFLMDEGEQRIHDAYPPATYKRLVALKRQYDPANLFHLNQNIRPDL